MSNNFDEQNPTNEPNAQPDSTAGVPERLAQQLGRGPQQFNVGKNPLAVPWGKMLSILDEIRYLNDQTRINTQSTATYLSKHMAELKTATQLNRDETTRAQVPGDQTRPPAPPLEEKVHIAELTPLQRVQYQLQAQHQSFLGASQSDQMEELRKLGMLTKEGKVRISGARDITPDELSQVVQYQKEQLSLHELPGNLQMSAVQFGKTLKAQLAGAMDDQIKQARGVENLRSGNVTPAGIFRHFGHFFGMGHGMPMGPQPINPQQGDVALGQGVADVFSRRTFSTKLGDLLDSRMQKNREAALAAGKTPLEAEAATGMAGRIAGLLGGASIPVVGEAMIAYGLLKEFGSKIPILGQLGKIDDHYRAMRQMGQLTGEDWRAGFSATEVDPYRLMHGGQFRRIPLVGSVLGLFDPITKEVANQIVQNVREAGLTGDQARQMEQSVASVYKDLGLDVQTTVTMIKDATRTGGESLRQVVAEMKTFDTAAHDLSVNINEYGASISATATSLRMGGAGPTATVQAQALMASAPLAMRNQAGQQQMVQSFQGMATRIGAMTGVLPTLVGTAQNLPRSMAAFQTTMTSAFAQAQQIVANQPGDRQRNAAAFLAQWNAPGINPFFGWQPDAILAQMGRISMGRGPQQVQRILAATQGYNQRLTALRGTQMKSLDELTPDQLAARGITRTHAVGFRAPGHYTYTWQGRHLNPSGRYRVEGDESRLSDEQIIEARKQAIKEVSTSLSKSQLHALRSHLKDRSYDFTEHLQKFMNIPRNQRNVINTPFGVIKLEFGPKAKKLGLQATVTQNTIAAGNIQSNQAYPYEPLRIDPFSP